jgi:hypothetical protein
MEVKELPNPFDQFTQVEINDWLGNPVTVKMMAILKDEMKADEQAAIRTLRTCESIPENLLGNTMKNRGMYLSALERVWSIFTKAEDYAKRA